MVTPDNSSEARPSKKSTPVAAPAPVSVQLTGPYVVIPLEVYDSLLTTQLAVQKGEYIATADVESRVKASVEAALLAMTRTLQREVASVSQLSNSSPAPNVS